MARERQTMQKIIVTEIKIQGKSFVKASALFANEFAAGPKITASSNIK